MSSRPLIAILLIVPLLAAGCVTESPATTNAANGDSGSSLADSWTEDIEIAREPFELSAATGFIHEFDVEIPVNATGLEVRIERSGNQVNFGYSGLGECDQAPPGDVSVSGTGSTSQGCTAPAAGVRTVSASMDGGQSSFVFVVTAHVRHVNAP